MPRSKTKISYLFFLIFFLFFTSCTWLKEFVLPIGVNDIERTSVLIAELPAGAEGLASIEIPACVLNEYSPQVAYVERVIDGDSIEVLINGQLEEVRYIGVNTPEYYSDARDAAVAATQLNRTYVEGRYILLFRDISDRDQYERLLRYVFTEEGFINAMLVEEGAAEARSYAPDIACQLLINGME